MVGVSYDVADGTSAAKRVLERMHAAHSDNIAAVNADQRFQFMVGREDILSKVVTSVVFAH